MEKLRERRKNLLFVRRGERTRGSKLTKRPKPRKSRSNCYPRQTRKKTFCGLSKGEKTTPILQRRRRHNLLEIEKEAKRLDKEKEQEMLEAKEDFDRSQFNQKKIDTSCRMDKMTVRRRATMRSNWIFRR